MSFGTWNPLGIKDNAVNESVYDQILGNKRPGSGSYQSYSAAPSQSATNSGTPTRRDRRKKKDALLDGGDTLSTAAAEVTGA